MKLSPLSVPSTLQQFPHQASTSQQSIPLSTSSTGTIQPQGISTPELSGLHSPIQGSNIPFSNLPFSGGRQQHRHLPAQRTPGPSGLLPHYHVMYGIFRAPLQRKHKRETRGEFSSYMKTIFSPAKYREFSLFPSGSSSS